MGLSMWQILVVLAIVLILFGPSRLPGLGRSIGEAIRSFKKGLDSDELDVTDSVSSDSAKGQEIPHKDRNTTESRQKRAETRA